MHKMSYDRQKYSDFHLEGNEKYIPVLINSDLVLFKYILLLTKMGHKF